MRKKYLRWLTPVLVLSLLSCATPPKKEDMGTVLGGVGGGLLGAQVGGSKNRTAAIIAGTLLGAIIGREVGRSIDRTDELMAQNVLEQNRTGQTTSWVNPDTNNQVAVTPTKTYQVSSGQYCREYTTEVWVGGEKQEAYGTACRQPDGSWQIQN
jgi:surface antigen